MLLLWVALVILDMLLLWFYWLYCSASAGAQSGKTTPPSTATHLRARLKGLFRQTSRSAGYAFSTFPEESILSFIFLFFETTISSYFVKLAEEEN